MSFTDSRVMNHLELCIDYAGLCEFSLPCGGRFHWVGGNGDVEGPFGVLSLEGTSYTCTLTGIESFAAPTRGIRFDDLKKKFDGCNMERLGMTPWNGMPTYTGDPQIIGSYEIQVCRLLNDICH